VRKINSWITEIDVWQNYENFKVTGGSREGEGGQLIKILSRVQKHIKALLAFEAEGFGCFTELEVTFW
jgi:hypothetical protein